MLADLQIEETGVTTSGAHGYPRSFELYHGPVPLAELVLSLGDEKHLGARLAA